MKIIFIFIAKRFLEIFFKKLIVFLIFESQFPRFPFTFHQKNSPQKLHHQKIFFISSHCYKHFTFALITNRRFLLWDNLGFYLRQSKYWITILLIIKKIRVRWTRISDMLLNRKLSKRCRECSHEVVRFLFFFALLNVFMVDPSGGFCGEIIGRMLLNYRQTARMCRHVVSYQTRRFLWESFSALGGGGAINHFAAKHSIN